MHYSTLISSYDFIAPAPAPDYALQSIVFEVKISHHTTSKLGKKAIHYYNTHVHVHTYSHTQYTPYNVEFASQKRLYL